jgi:hypothetical protein
MATKQQPASENEMNLGSFEAATEKPQPTKAAKKRAGKVLKEIAAETGISGPAIGAESINLSGDTAKLAKQADEKTVRKEFVAKAQENADFLVKEFKEFGELCREAEIAISNRDAFFNVRIKNPAFFKRCQDVRDFFATKSPDEYLVHNGEKYYRAPEFFLAAIGVTFQYVSRQMLKYRELYETLTGDKLPPKSNAGGRRTASTGHSTGSDGSPAGKVGLDEFLEKLSEEVRGKVLAEINGTQATETPDEVFPKFSNAGELVEAIVNLLAIAETFAPTDRLNILRAVQQDVQQRLSETIDVPFSAQLTDGDSVAA